MEDVLNSAVQQDERLGGTSASNAYADMLCPGRHLAQKGQPQPPPSDDAEFGTQIHNALAGIQVELKPSQLSIKDSCDDIVAKLIDDVFGLDAKKVESLREQRLWVLVNKQFRHSARLDLIVHFDNKALIVEYKTLPGDVQESTENLQLRDQAVMAGGTMPKLDEIYVAPVQPLITHSPSLCRYDKQALEIAKVDMFTRVMASNDPASPRIAGPIQCKFCFARYGCNQYLKMVQVSVPEIAMVELSSVDVRTWTPEHRSVFCRSYPVAEKWIEECKRQIKIALEADPSSVPGFRLAEGSIKRPVSNINELHNRFIADGGKTEDFLKTLSLSKGDFEATIRRITGLKGKGLKAHIDKLLDGVTTDRKDAPSISKI